MNVLLIGGYRFLGRAIIDCALSRGDRVTAFNRGLTWPDGGVPGVELLRGDRVAGLSLLGGRRWDVAIDTSPQIPSSVSASAGYLRDAVEHYTVVSSVSVYPWPMPAGTKETAPVTQLAPGADPDDPAPERYGARKVLCEAAAETAMPGRTAAIRAGMIAGPYDYLDRLTYWIERAAGDGDYIVPGRPDRPMQLIDVVDLAEWMLDLAIARRPGAFNATGPISGSLDMAQLIKACADVTGGRGRPVWVDDAALLERGIDAGTEPFPYWVERSENGVFEVDLTAARDAGLRTRPLRDTIERTYAWIRQRADPARNRGLDRTAELALLAEVDSR
jgi:2'-hydroxyisoflavone reductase